MKIAFCYSAHLRHYRRAYNSILNSIYEPFSKIGEIDSFIHTWDTLGPSFSWRVYHNNTEGLDQIKTDENDVISLYKPKKIVVENYQEAIPKLLLKNYTHKEPTNPALFKDGILSTLVTFYKIWQANELKKDYEKENNFKYDIVVRLRPDSGYTSLPPLSTIDYDYIYLPGPFGDGLANDYFALSNSENMDKYSECFVRLKEIYARHEYDFGGERTLFYHLTSLGNNLNMKIRTLDNGFQGEKV